LFSKGDQLKVKLAKLKFSEIGDGRLFLVFGGRLVIGRGDYVVQSRFSLLASFFPRAWESLQRPEIARKHGNNKKEREKHKTKCEGRRGAC